MLFSNRKKRLKNERSLLLKQKSLALSVMFHQLTLTSQEPGIAENEDDIIVSLTSFSHRVNDVYLTIESIFQQTQKASKVYLWLAEKDFPNREKDLPKSLIQQMERGLTVKFCDPDLGPYTKFFYTLKENPESLIVTVDDDILYPFDMIDQLYRAYKKEPNVIHCQRAHRIMKDDQGGLIPYKKWTKNYKGTEASADVFPTGVGGVMYFPGCFADEILDKEAFLKLAPNSDDVWLKAMTLKKGVLSKAIQDSRPWGDRYLIIEGSQLVALKRKNKTAGQGNDPKLKAVFEQYNLYQKLEG